MHSVDSNLGPFLSPFRPAEFLIVVMKCIQDVFRPGGRIDSGGGLTEQFVKPLVSSRFVLLGTRLQIVASFVNRIASIRGLRDIWKGLFQDLAPFFSRHGIVPTPIVNSQKIEGGSHRFTRHSLDIVGQPDLANEGKQMLAVREQALQQAFVDGQVFRGRILLKHPFAFAFSEKLDFFQPNRHFGVNAQLRIFTQNQMFHRAPLSFDCCHRAAD